MYLLPIYRSGVIISTISIDEQTVLVKKIMNAHKITSSFVSKTVLPLEIGDYITHESENYYLNQLPSYKKENDNTYKYTIVFQSVLYDLLNKLLISSDGLSDFSYTGNAEDMLNFIINNINEISPGWAVGDVDDSEKKTLDFLNESCRVALTKISDAFGFEFELSGKTIHFKEAIGTIRDLTFEYGQNKGLYSLTRKSVEDKTLVTRLYGFGSTKNLPYTYRDRAKRLVFSERYLEKNVSIYGIKEAHYTDDEIFPNRTAPLTGLNIVFVNDVYNTNESYIEDTSIDFDLNDYLVEGTTAKIVFKSGDLSGYQFEIWKFDFENKRIYINPLQETDGYILPNPTNKPVIGDLYTLVDINMPQIYIIEAEDKLKAATQKFLDENCKPKSLYLVTIDPKFSKTNEITLNAGELVKIVDKQMGIDSSIRISQISYPIVNKYKIDAIIADFIPYTLQEKVTKQSIVTSRNISNIIKNTINNNNSSTVINNNSSSTTINEGNAKKIEINGRLYTWEKGFDNLQVEVLEIGDVIMDNYWNRYIFVKKWKYLGGYKELRTSWDELETLDETPE